VVPAGLYQPVREALCWHHGGQFNKESWAKQAETLTRCRIPTERKVIGNNFCIRQLPFIDQKGRDSDLLNSHLKERLSCACRKISILVCFG
jgi:hypothetical protein